MGRYKKQNILMYLQVDYETVEQNNLIIGRWSMKRDENGTIYTGTGSEELAAQLIELQRQFNIKLMVNKAKILYHYLSGRIPGSKNESKKNYKLGKISLREMSEFVKDVETLKEMEEGFQVIWDILPGETKEEKVQALPVSSTAIVRNELKNLLTKEDSKYDRTVTPKWQKETYRKLMRACKLDAKRFRILEYSTRGGLDLANESLLGKTIEGAIAGDVNSQYPDAMVCDEFPLGFGEYKESITEYEYNNLYDMSKTAMVMTCVFKNIRLKEGCLPYIKLLSTLEYKTVNPVFYNVGSKDTKLVRSADVCVAVIWNPELELIKEYYEYDSLEIKESIIYSTGMLPAPFRKYVLELYQAKTRLKGDKEKEYSAAKIKLNALAGAMQMKPIYAEELAKKTNKKTTKGNLEYAAFTDEEIQQELDQEYNIKKTKDDEWPKVFGRFCSYVTGKYLTMICRVRIMRLAMQAPEQVIQTATDAIYFKDCIQARRIFAEYDIVHKRDVLRKVSRDFELELLIPKTASRPGKPGVEKPLGCFDVSEYEFIKVLGVKRYLTQYDGHIELVHAGATKEETRDKLIEGYCRTGIDPFDQYTDDFKIVAKPSLLYEFDPLLGKDGKVIETAYVKLRIMTKEDEELYIRIGAG